MQMAEYTNFYVDYALDNKDAQEDTTISATEYKNFSQLNNLPYGTDCEKFITQEHNFVVLDGSYEYRDNIGFMSEEMSDSTGHFTTNPMITATFRHQHTSFILSFDFVEDAPKRVEIKWYLNNALMYGMIQEWDPNETKCQVQYPIEAYNRITIEFLETLPNRYIKLNKLEFGATMHWDETIVKSATMVKGLNRISDMLSVDTLTFELVDTTNSMNFGNPKGLHTLFKKDQAMYPVEVLDGVAVPLGKFYLDSFTTEGNIGKINAYSYMGILDKIPYNEGGIYNGVVASTIFESIFTAAGLHSSQYNIDTTTASQLIYGTIKPTTCREALQQLLFACNSIIDTSNVNKIKVDKYSDIVESDLTRHNKIATKVSSLEFVSGVQLSYTTYQLPSSSEELAKETYSAGEHTVVFSEPCSNISVSGAELVKSSTYYVTFVADGITEVTITGKQYEETIKMVSVNKDLREGQVENVIEYTTTLCNTDTANTLSEILLDYHSNTLELQVQHYATDDISMDNAHFVENPVAELDGFVAMYESRTFDLTGGFIDSAKMIGKFNTADRYYFTGREDTNSHTELYAGDGTEII